MVITSSSFSQGGSVVVVGLSREMVAYTVLLCMTCGLSLSIAVYAWHRRHVAGGVIVTLLLLSTVAWTGLSAAELLCPTLEMKVFWNDLEFWVAGVMAFAWLIFALQYVQRETWLRPLTYVLLMIEPFMTAGLLWTNASHGWVRTSVSLDLLPFPTLIFEFGPWFWIGAGYRYVLLLLGVLLLIEHFLRAPRLYRAQILILILMILIPIVARVLSLFEGDSFSKSPDLSSLAIALGMPIAILGIYYFRLFDVVPISRETITDKLIDGVMVLDMEERVVDLNRAAQELTGYSADKALGKDIAEVFPWWAQVMARDDDTLFLCTEVALGEGRDLRYCDLHISSLTNQRGQPAGFLLSLRDVTERHRAQQQLRASESQHRALVEGSLQGIAMIQGDPPHITFTNSALAKMLGYTIPELLAMSSEDLLAMMSAEDRAAFVERYRCYRRGDPVPPSRTYTVRRRDGEQRILEVLSSSVEYQGEMALQSTFLDVTKRWRAREALQASEAQYRSTIDAIDEIVHVVDHDLRILLYNRIVEERLASLGLDVSDLLGKRVDEVFPFLPESVLDEYRQVFETGVFLITEESLEIGERNYVTQTRKIPVCEGQRVISVVTIIQDITDRKRAEEMLQQRNADLQARNEDLDAFAHTVAHDLRDPLPIIIGYAELLMADYESLPRETVVSSLRTVSRMAYRINEILEALMLLAGLRNAEVWLEPVDMAAILAKVQERLAHLIESEKARILSPDTWPLALGYAPWVEEVWVNYITNAIKYGGRPPEVDLGASACGATIRFWVRDNGHGLTAEEQRLLFIPFTRLDSLRVTGHGLGLSIVRRIVEKLGGEVGVESRVGEGSIFSFTLPAFVIDDGEDPTAHLPGPVPESPVVPR